ncbi:MAG TPA: hypothetical protein VGH19_12640 [Verrucomicrobiae bacterium]
MTFLPMVERELRVLARKPATYRWRWLIGGLAFGMALFLITIMGLVGQPRGWGEALFWVLTVYAAIVCLLAGMFGTADIISEEKRDGTLGLLFLTDLKGYDVVIGKFSAVALNAFYWLLAIIPVLALPLLIGGVTFGEFVRVSFGLANLLFFTMAVGTWASSRSIEIQSSFLKASSVMILCCLLTPMMYLAPYGLVSWASVFGSSFNLGATYERLAVLTFSPVVALLSSGDDKYTSSPAIYMWSLLGSHLLAWSLLLMAAWRLPKIWQQPAREAGNWVASKITLARKSTTFDERAAMLDENPMLFLMRPTRGMRLAIKGLIALSVLIVLVDIFLIDEASFLHVPFRGGIIRWAVLFPLEVMLTFQACRFFTYARSSGLFELLASTPLTVKQIVSAHWTVLNRTFQLPFALAFIFMLFGGVRFMLDEMNSGMSSSSPFFLHGIQMFTVVMGVGLKVLDYFLLGWMAAWMSLKLKRPGWAAFFTLLFALVIPGFLCWLGYLFKPVLIAVSRHYVVYELPRLVRMQFDARMPVAAAIRTTPPPIR